MTIDSRLTDMLTGYASAHQHPFNIAAPFFTVVEIFGILGLRDDLFSEMQQRIGELRQQQSTIHRDKHGKQ